MKHKLTIVICTYNRAHILPAALESLLRQTVSPDDYSLLIIDNNSTDDTQEVLIPFKNKFPHMRIVMEYNQGIAYARTRTLHEVTTPWFASLDSDAKAHPDWVETILKTIEKGDFDGFGGPYYAWHHYGPAPRWLPEDFGTYESPQGYGLLKGDTYIPGGNSVLRCDAARSIGTFSTELGMSGNRCGYGEETHFFERMRTAGYRMGYVPHLKIDHCVLPYKYTLRWQIRSTFEYGKSANYVANIKNFFPLRVLFHCGRAIVNIISFPFTQRENKNFPQTVFKNLRQIIWDIGLLYERNLTKPYHLLLKIKEKLHA